MLSVKRFLFQFRIFTLRQVIWTLFSLDSGQLSAQFFSAVIYI